MAFLDINNLIFFKCLSYVIRDVKESREKSVKRRNRTRVKRVRNHLLRALPTEPLKLTAICGFIQVLFCDMLVGGVLVCQLLPQ